MREEVLQQLKSVFHIKYKLSENDYRIGEG